jgi:hypothetical protein
MMTFAGGGVKATQLTRRVELGNQLEIDCRAEPRVKLPVVFSWRWIVNGAVVDLDHNRLPPSINCIKGNEIIVIDPST